MEKENKVYSLIKTKLEEIGIVNHPGIKEIISGCFDWGMTPEEASVEVKNGSVVVSKKYSVNPIGTDKPDVAISERFAIIKKQEDNVVLTIGSLQNAYKVKDNKVWGQKEFLSQTEERIINQYGIEMKRTGKEFNFDGIATHGFTCERRGIQEVYYERFYGHDSEKGIASIEVDKLESLSIVRPDKSVNYNYQSSLSDEQIEKFTSKLTPAQQLFLKNLPNDGLLPRVIDGGLASRRGR